MLGIPHSMLEACVTDWSLGRFQPVFLRSKCMCKGMREKKHRNRVYVLVYGKKFSLSVTDLAHAQYGHMIPMTLLESLLSLRRHQTFDWVELVYSDFQFGNTTPASFKTPCTAPGWDQAAHQSDMARHQSFNVWPMHYSQTHSVNDNI